MANPHPTYTVLFEFTDLTTKTFANVQESQLAQWSDPTVWTVNVGLKSVTVSQN